MPWPPRCRVLTGHPTENERTARPKDPFGLPGIVLPARDGKSMETTVVDHSVQTLIGEWQVQRVTFPDVHRDARFRRPRPSGRHGSRREVDSEGMVPALREKQHVGARTAADVEHGATLGQEPFGYGQSNGRAGSGFEPRKLLVRRLLVRRAPLGTVRQGAPPSVGRVLPRRSSRHDRRSVGTDAPVRRA